MNTNSSATVKPAPAHPQKLTEKMNVFAKPAAAAPTVTFSNCASAPSSKAMNFSGGSGGFGGGVIG